jgi:hypothetical protein
MAISVIGTPASAASTTVTVPAHAIGDYIVIVAFRSATTAPTLPAGFINIPTAGTGSGNSCSYRVGYKVATATNDTSGTWTNASGLLCTVYRGVTAVGSGVSATKAAATTATIGTFTLVNANSASWVVAYAGHAATSTQGTPLAGATTSRVTQTSGTFNAGMFDTNAGVNSFAATTSSNTTSVVSFGGAFELIAADGMSTLADPFNQVTLDTIKWGQFTAGSATFTYASTGAQVNYPSSSTAATDGDITSNLCYNLVGNNAYSRILAVPSAATSADAVLWLRMDASNWLRWVYEAGTLYAQYQVAGVTTTPFSVAYNGTTHLWWQIIETGGNTLWQTSTDGLSWTTQATVADTTHGLRVGALLVGMAGVCFQVETNPGTFKWNNFNTPSGTAFTAPQSDSVTTSDAAVKKVVLNKSDTATSADAPVKNVALAKSDSATATDTSRRTAVLNKSDTASTSDSIVVTRGLILHIADRVAALEVQDSDNFDDNVLNTTYWDDQSLGAGSETGGKYQFVVPTASTNYYAIESRKLYDLTENTVAVQLVSVGGATFGSCILYVSINSTNKVFFSVDAGNLAAYEIVSGVQNFLFSVAYSTTMQYLQIRGSGGNTYWEYSTDGDNWVELYHKASPISMAAVHVALQAGSYDFSQPGFTAVFDNFYVTGNAVTKGLVLNRSDSPSTSDAALRNVTLRQSDSTTPTEAIVKKVSKIVADSVATSDLAAIAILIKLQFSDSVSSSDATTKKTGKGLSDSTTAADATAKSVKKVPADTVTSSDSFSRTSLYYRSFSESVSTADANSLRITKILADTISAPDTIIRNIGLRRSDLTTVADTIRKALSKNPADSVVLDDASAKRIVKILNDTVLATELVTGVALRVPQVIPSLPDGISAVDNAIYLGTEPSIDGIAPDIDYYVQLQSDDQAAALGPNDITGILT